MDPGALNELIDLLADVAARSILSEGETKRDQPTTPEAVAASVESGSVRCGDGRTAKGVGE